MNGSWFRASFASVKQNSSSPRSMNSRGVHANTSMPSRRPPVSGMSSRHAAARRRPEAHARRTARARRRSRASPRPRRRRLVEQPVRLVEPQQVLALDVEHEHAEVRGALADDRRARPSAPAGRTTRTTSSSRRPRCRRSTCGRPCARRRSRGRRAPAAPSRPSPTGSGRSIWSAYSARARSSPVARSTGSPGSAETQTSGSTRVTATARGPHLLRRHDPELGDAVGVGLVAARPRRPPRPR